MVTAFKSGKTDLVCGFSPAPAWTGRTACGPSRNKSSTISAESAIFDGEVVVLNDSGTTSFADLQAAFQEGVEQAAHVLRVRSAAPQWPQSARAAAHRSQGDSGPAREGNVDGVLHYSEHLESDGEVIFRKACELQAEGIVSKRAASPYHSGRGGDWLK